MNRGDKSAKQALRCQQQAKAQQQSYSQNKKRDSSALTKDSRRGASSKTRVTNDTREIQSDTAKEVKPVAEGRRSGNVGQSVPNGSPKNESAQRKLSDASNASEDYSKDSGCVSCKLSSSDSSSETSDCTSEGNKPDPQNSDTELSWVDGRAYSLGSSTCGKGNDNHTRETKDSIGNELSDLGASLGVFNISGNYSNVTESLMMGDTEDLVREVEDLRSENEYLKDEMEELRCEMVEMRDMFQEEEVYQLQQLRLQLEQANKTCRILQYRLRKAERRSIRVAQTGQVDGELVRSLEHDIKVAKSVSLRLRNELESVQKKKSLLEVENERLRERTQELEVAKQVLQTEMDKIFSKENSLKRRSVRTPSSKAERRLSQQMEEDSADLKCQLHFAKEELALMCKKLTKLVLESDGMCEELAKYHSTYGDIDTSQLPEGKAHYGRAREAEVKAHLKLVEEEATLLSRRIVELEVENRGLRAEMSDLRDKFGGTEEEEEPLALVTEKFSQVNLGWDAAASEQGVTMEHSEFSSDNEENGANDMGGAKRSLLRDRNPAQAEGMLSVCQITREGPVGGEWDPLDNQESGVGNKEDTSLHGMTMKDYETLLSLKDHACIVSSAIQLLTTTPKKGYSPSSVSVSQTEVDLKAKAQPSGHLSFQGPVNDSLALLQPMLLTFIGRLEKLLTGREICGLSLQNDAHFWDSYILPFLYGECVAHNLGAQDILESPNRRNIMNVKERVKQAQQGPPSHLSMVQSCRDPKMLLTLQTISVLYWWCQVKEPGQMENEMRAKTISVLQRLLRELEAEHPDQRTACDSGTMTMCCKMNQDVRVCARVSDEKRYFEIDREYKAEERRSRQFSPYEPNQKHWCYLSQEVAQLDQQDPIKTWDHPIMPLNFPDLDFEQISMERSHTAPESTSFRIYYSPPSARRVQLAQLRHSPITDKDYVSTASPWCTPPSSLSPLYIGLSANLSDDMKEMTASWRQPVQSSPLENGRRLSGGWVDVACSGTQTKVQPQMVSVGLQTDGPQGVSSARNSPSRVLNSSLSSARTHKISTSLEKVTGRALRPKNTSTSPKMYRRHSASSLPASTTFSNSLSPSSSSSTTSRERSLWNLSNPVYASPTLARPANNKANGGQFHTTLNCEVGNAGRNAKPPSKAAGANRYGLVTEFLRKVSGRTEKPGAGKKGKADLKHLERIPTRPPAVPLHRNDSITRIVNRRFMKQRDEKGNGQSQAIRGNVSKDVGLGSITAEDGNYDCSSSSTLTFCFARPAHTAQQQTSNQSKPQRHRYSSTFGGNRDPSCE